MDLLYASIVAIDGQVQSLERQGEKLHTREAKGPLGEIDVAIAKYMSELDRAGEVLARTGIRPIDTRLSRLIKKLAHDKNE